MQWNITQFRVLLIYPLNSFNLFLHIILRKHRQNKPKFGHQELRILGTQSRTINSAIYFVLLPEKNMFFEKGAKKEE